MFTKAADQTTALSSQPDAKFLEQDYENVREIYQSILLSRLNKFTFSVLDFWWNELSSIVRNLEHVPEEPFKECMSVIQGLSEARNELREARFLFDVEEIHPVHRFIMRNRAVGRGRKILSQVIDRWPHR